MCVYIQIRKRRIFLWQYTLINGVWFYGWVNIILDRTRARTTLANLQYFSHFIPFMCACFFLSSKWIMKKKYKKKKKKKCVCCESLASTKMLQFFWSYFQMYTEFFSLHRPQMLACTITFQLLPCFYAFSFVFVVVVVLEVRITFFFLFFMAVIYIRSSTCTHSSTKFLRIK